MNRILILILMTTMLGACSRRDCNTRAYVDYVNDSKNGLMVNKDVGEFQYTLLYKPLEYVVLAEERYVPKSLEDLHQKASDYDDMQYYTLRIKVDGFNEEILKYQLKSPAQYYSRLEYYSFLVKNDMKLIDGQDTLECAMSHMERSYNLNNYCNLLLGFKKINKGVLQTKKLFFEDRIFGNGMLQFEILADRIKNVPIIKKI